MGVARSRQRSGESCRPQSGPAVIEHQVVPSLARIDHQQSEYTRDQRVPYIIASLRRYSPGNSGFRRKKEKKQETEINK